MNDTRHFAFFQNRQCEYFPCHTGIKDEDFSCIFCYCPLYALGEECGGNFSYDNDDGIKDCSGCLLPHQRGSFDLITEKCRSLIDMVKK
ncbi:MAG: cysteine-rich small domain-containing protein [Eubacteriaceae bacterium]|nr:cysteine-rich small domain-containing protein [Eubacteriaceae bacterium]